MTPGRLVFVFLSGVFATGAALLALSVPADPTVGPAPVPSPSPATAPVAP